MFVFNVPPIAIRSYRDRPMALIESHSKEPWIELRTPGYNNNSAEGRRMTIEIIS